MLRLWSRKVKGPLAGLESTANRALEALQREGYRGEAIEPGATALDRGHVSLRLRHGVPGPAALGSILVLGIVCTALGAFRVSERFYPLPRALAGVVVGWCAVAALFPFAGIGWRIAGAALLAFGGWNSARKDA